MNIQNVNIAAIARATIIPADPLATGDFEVGHSRGVTAFEEIDQVFSIKASAMTGTGLLNLVDGTLTGHTGGTVAGGDGKDPDGQDVAFTKLMAFQFRNTGTTDITVEQGTFTGTGNPIAGLVVVPPGGDFLVTAPAGNAYTAYTLEITEKASAAACSFELVALGKL